MSDNQTPEQLEAEIAEQRAQLAQTVDQLGAKLDVLLNRVLATDRRLDSALVSSALCGNAAAASGSQPLRSRSRHCPAALHLASVRPAWFR